MIYAIIHTDMLHISPFSSLAPFRSPPIVSQGAQRLTAIADRGFARRVRCLSCATAFRPRASASPKGARWDSPGQRPGKAAHISLHQALKGRHVGTDTSCIHARHYALTGLH